MVKSKDGTLGLEGGGFSKKYADIISLATYGLSNADWKTINEEQAHCSSQIATVIAEAKNSDINWSQNSGKVPLLSADADSIDIEISYSGVTLVSSIPANLSADDKTGWYDNQILWEVVMNDDEDRTGYRLTSAEFAIQNYFGYGKRMARLKTFVISQYPDIRITIKDGDIQDPENYYSTGTYQSIESILKNILIPVDQYTVRNTTINKNSQTIIIELGRPTGSNAGIIPVEEQNAFIIGDVPAYPPD